MPGAPVESYPLTPMQQGMLFHHLSEEGTGVDIEQIVFRLREELDLDAFQRAWEAAARRHPPLRKGFRWDGVDEPLQEVWEEAALPFTGEDWRELSEEERDRRFEHFLAEDRRRGFDLSSPPAARLAVFRTGDAEYCGVWSFHHLLMDGRSFAIVLGDAFDAYQALVTGGPADPGTGPPRSFREHVDWLREHGRRPESQAFWTEYLRDFTAPTPLALPGPQPGAGKEAAGRGERERRLSQAATDRLRAFARAEGVTLNTLVQAAWALLLSRYSGEREVVFGATRACRRSSIPDADAVAGVFINTLPVRVACDAAQPVGEWLRALRALQVDVREHEHTALVDVQAKSRIPVGTPLFESLIVYDNQLLDSVLKARGGPWEQREFVLRERTSFPLTLYGYGEDELLLQVAYDRDRFGDWSIERLLAHLATLLERLPEDALRPLGELSVVPEEERRLLLQDWNATAAAFPAGATLPELFEAQAARTPDAIALMQGARELGYRELDAAANRLAHRLRELGVATEDLVGVATGRTAEMVVALLAIHKAGGAYLPLDPDYPAERLGFMIEDSSVGVILTDAAHAGRLPSTEAQVLVLDEERERLAALPADAPPRELAPGNLAYVIYTSGSTGRPKGVQVEHRNVVNFCVGMDERIGAEPGTWLAVTSLSFDISVLELLWTLTRGFRVVLYSGEDRRAARGIAPRPAGARDTAFSLFYFASDEGERAESKYRLVLEGARFADTHGFEAVWTPERHFHRFGGLYPNPAVMSAALATITENVQLRSGSVVLPLHHPVRVAEEWSVVDNLSGGRVGISVASGWHPNDFVLAPENYAERKELMERGIETLRRLWRGEKIAFPAPDGGEVEVSTLPRPVQEDLPIWVTAAGNPETFRIAGRSASHVLTHLLGQSVEELEAKVSVYREAWREAGHPGEGHVTIMLHTFVGDDFDEVKELVREPMKGYLRSAMDLIKKHMSAWSAVRTEVHADAEEDATSLESLSEEDRESLLEYSFERYVGTSALLGTVESCLPLVYRLQEMGIDEIACLVDFGVEGERVLQSLDRLDELRRAAIEPPEATAAVPETVDELLTRHGVSHMQCTPSMARMLVADERSRAALSGLQELMVGGEAFPPSLARELSAATDAAILNMYGPTETTIWSTTHAVERGAESVPIGRPIANTDLYVLDGELRPVPIGVPGELYIGGEGVVRGYLGRPELTAERFVADPIAGGGARMYRTGDLVRYRPDGVLDFLGRTDHQVKLRGHRIELGEIEKVLEEHPGVREAAVVPREDVPGDVRLVAYIVAAEAGAPHVGELREQTAVKLPDYMVPAHVVRLDAFPLTPNKKIDRKALPRPDQVAAAPAAPPAAPGNELERDIAELWSQLLGISQVGRDDNFFDLGGHSLLVVQMHGRLKRLTTHKVGVTDLFRFPTVRSLAEFLSNGGDQPAGAPGAAREKEPAQAAGRRESLRARRQRARMARKKGDPA